MRPFHRLGTSVIGADVNPLAAYAPHSVPRNPVLFANPPFNSGFLPKDSMLIDDIPIQDIGCMKKSVDCDLWSILVGKHLEFLIISC